MLFEHPPYGWRGADEWGGGAFLASREHLRDGELVREPHRGRDALAHAGDPWTSQVDGDVLRRKYPYGDDLAWGGLLIRAAGGLLVTYFYLLPLAEVIGARIVQGQEIGVVQDLTTRYPARPAYNGHPARGPIPVHVHVEIQPPKGWALPREWAINQEYMVLDDHTLRIDPLALEAL